MKLFKCEKCGNIIMEINDKCLVSCCGEEMKLLEAGSVDAAVEKHVPVVEVKDNIVSVVCGEVLHPMEEKHYIEFMVLETSEGSYIKYLKPNMEPKTTFVLNEGEKIIAAYAYCNLHGLWKSTN